MATEFLSDASELLIHTMRQAGIGPDVCGQVAQQWQEGVISNWGGERAYIGATTAQERRDMSSRDAAILRDWQAGERVAALARRYRISRQHLYRIVLAAG